MTADRGTSRTALAHRRIRKVVLRTQQQFVAYYRSHHIIITREPDGRFYGLVSAPSGGRTFDGWLARDVVTMDAAITEVMSGACLIKETSI